MRAVVFVTEHTIKGTDRHPQEYQSPLLILSGEDYSRITFEELHRRLCDALRGNRAPVIAEILGPGGKHRVIRAEDEDKPHRPEANAAGKSLMRRRWTGSCGNLG
jgi:hypothetical protein